MKPEDVIADRTRPYTGAEYMRSLRDGREVYIDGERVRDVTSHPALRNSVRSIARLYDALHDPKRRDVLTCPTDTGSGEPRGGIQLPPHPDPAGGLPSDPQVGSRRAAPPLR